VTLKLCGLGIYVSVHALFSGALARHVTSGRGWKGSHINAKDRLRYCFLL